VGFAALVAVAQGCDDSSDTTTTSTSASSGSGSGNTTTASVGGGGSGPGSTTTTGVSTGGGGSTSYSCATPVTGSTHSSPIAVTADDAHLVVANKDVGTVTVMSIDYTDGNPKMTVDAEIPVGANKSSEPSSVYIDGCSDRAWVTLRKDQEVVEIAGISTGAPALTGRSIAVGSEPTGITGNEDNTKLYVANWVEGTVSVIDTADLTPAADIDLNKALIATNVIGAPMDRPSLAHPRALAYDTGTKHLYVTEWFAQRTAAETPGTAANTDTNKEGLLYNVAVGTGAVTTITLPSVQDTGLHDHNDAVTGCYPNQLSAVNIDNGFAYVTSTCASPKGPLGVFAPTQTGCLATPSICGAIGGACDTSVNPLGICKPNATDVKTTTHPAISFVDLSTNTGTTKNLDAVTLATPAGARKVPLLPTDISFFNGFGYITSLGTDSVVRLTFANGAPTQMGSPQNNFITMRKDAMDKQFRTPVGIAMAHSKGAFGFVANEAGRDVTAVAFNAQAIAGTAPDQRVTASSALATAGTPEEAVARGKAFFETGLGRWSLAGEGWGSCAACHVDGLSDNVTWYFNRGPRQSVSLDGTFASNDPNDQRILNWTAIFDEIPDFEANTRGVSGGLGALVTKDAMMNDVRINTAAEVPPQQGLQGSSEDIANPNGGAPHPHTYLKDWQEIKAYIQSIRSPRRPRGLVAADVAAGKTLFQSSGQGNCVGCHSGPKWTISKRFYAPSDTNNPADGSAMGLEGVSWNTALNGFPAALFPTATVNSQRMRFGAAAGVEQLQCAVRPVGTFTTSVPEVGVVELKQDMTSAGEGSGAAANDPGIGFNIPSMLGVQVGAPFFHAGNARTLEESLSATFKNHHQSAVAAVFNPDATTIRQLVAYLLSIDEDEQAPAAVPKGNLGGPLCF